MPRLALECRRAVRFTALALALIIAILSSPAAVRGDLLSGEEGADALAAAYAAATASSGDSSAIPTHLPYWSDDPAGWQEALRRDPDLRFSNATNQLIYTCEGADQTTTASAAVAPPAAAELAAAAAPPEMGLAAATATADIPVASGLGFAMPKEGDPAIANAFKLHSRPGAPKRIVLDFTGHTLRKGTWWGRESKVGDVPLVVPPYDLDKNPSSFSVKELQAIVGIWRVVAEDYSRWNVDVTTEEPPGTDDEADAALAWNGHRLIVGKNTGWRYDEDPVTKKISYPGGVSFMGGFTDPSSGPASFVFNEYPPNVAVAASHEVGHSFGMGHHGVVAKPDGTPKSGYYTGHGNWAPIMGMPYGKNVIQWSKGDYAYADNPNQDDIAIISKALAAAPWSGGGRDMASAPLLDPPLNGAVNMQTGVFTSGSESHFYKFVASRAGSVYLQLSVNPKGVDGNSRTHLAAKVRILQLSTMAGVPTQFNNVGTGGIDQNIPDTSNKLFSIPAAGDYFIEMAATRNGDASTGYTEYGTSGTYALTMWGDVFEPTPPPPVNLVCMNATNLQLTSAAGNCNSGITVQAKDVYKTLDGRAAAVSPALGTVLAAGTSRDFTASLDGKTCTTTVKVLACGVDTVTCFNPSYTLAPGQCAGRSIPSAELYRLSGAGGTAPAGSATTTLPADGMLGPGNHQNVVKATAGGASCSASVTVNPCQPSVVSTTSTIAVPCAPGTCTAGAPPPSLVVSASTLGRGAVSINARTTATGSVVSPPLKAGKYYVQVVYPGGMTSTVSASAVSISPADTEDPRASIKPSIVRDARGFICARGGSSTSTQACVSVSTSTGVLDLSDNCGASALTRSYQCASSQNACPSSMSSTTSKLCVPVRSGGGRVEATYLLTVTDKSGRRGQVQIPIAGYHYRDRPAGVTCYTA